MEMSKQWQQEGMTVHAFAYDPVSVKACSVSWLLTVVANALECFGVVLVHVLGVVDDGIGAVTVTVTAAVAAAASASCFFNY